jgi:hypothetical protein
MRKSVEVALAGLLNRVPMATSRRGRGGPLLIALWRTAKLPMKSVLYAMGDWHATLFGFTRVTCPDRL